jgi:hypothetical protein
MSSQSFNRKMNERIVPVGYLSTLIGATSGRQCPSFSIPKLSEMNQYRTSSGPLIYCP